MGVLRIHALSHTGASKKRARMKISSCPTAELVTQKSSKEKYSFVPVISVF